MLRWILGLCGPPRLDSDLPVPLGLDLGLLRPWQLDPNPLKAPGQKSGSRALICMVPRFLLVRKELTTLPIHKYFLLFFARAKTATAFFGLRRQKLQLQLSGPRKKQSETRVIVFFSRGQKRQLQLFLLQQQFFCANKECDCNYLART